MDTVFEFRYDDFFYLAKIPKVKIHKIMKLYVSAASKTLL